MIGGGVPAEFQKEEKELLDLLKKLTPGQRAIIRSIAEEFLAAGSEEKSSVKDNTETLQEL